MRKLALALAVALAAPTPALAVTSGTLSGSATIGYSCDMTLPGDITLASVDALNYEGTAAITLSQNGNTTYDLSVLTINKPNAATIGGQVELRNPAGGAIVIQTSESIPASGNQAGELTAAEGAVYISIQETSAAALIPGSYSVSSTLSCSEQI